MDTQTSGQAQRPIHAEQRLGASMTPLDLSPDGIERMVEAQQLCPLAPFRDDVRRNYITPSDLRSLLEQAARYSALEARVEGLDVANARRNYKSRAEFALHIADEIISMHKVDRLGGWPKDEITIVDLANELRAVLYPEAEPEELRDALEHTKTLEGLEVGRTGSRLRTLASEVYRLRTLSPTPRAGEEKEG